MGWISGGMALAGALMASNASGDASDAQVLSADRANASNERIFNKQVELQQPFRDVGLAANNRLAYLLGLTTSPYGTSQTGSTQGALTADILRGQLAPKYTTSRQVYGPTGQAMEGENTIPMGYSTENTIDENSLNAEIARRLQEDASIRAASDLAAAQGDQNYGSLLRDFSMSDFQADPGYAFRQSEGMKGIEGGAAARGGLLSGGALKAIQKYGQDLASQEYGNAYGRFNANQTNKYNRLAGIVNTGQGATNQITNAAGQLGQSNASNIIGAGNAQAAGIVGQANAWNSALGQGANAYQNNKLLDMIRNPGTSYRSNSPSIESYYGY